MTASGSRRCPPPRVGTWTAAANVSEADLGDELKLSAVYTPESGKFPNGDVEVQWYSWREGDKDWQPEAKRLGIRATANPTRQP